MSSRVSRLLVSARMDCVHSISMTKYSWCLLLENLSVHAWGGMGVRDSSRGIRTPESLGSVNNRRQWAEETSPREAGCSWPDPHSLSGVFPARQGSGRGVERKESQRSQLGKARHAAGRDLKKHGFGSPHVQEDTLVTPQLRTRARLHPHQGPSSFFWARSPENRRTLSSQWPVLS